MENFLLRSINSKILKLKDLSTTLNRIQKMDITFCNGCFDILHRGHIEMLSYAAGFNGLLIVGLNSDSSVKKLKGPTRPIRDEYERSLNLASLSFVDFVIIFEEENPIHIITELSPLRIIKGGDYDIDKMVEKDIIKERGILLEFYPLLEGKSTTNIINTMTRNYEA